MNADVMTLADLIETMALTHDRINDLWQLFIWIHLTIMGALALLPRKLSFMERFVIIGAYVAFIYINRSAVIDAYDYLNVLQTEIASSPDSGLGGGLVRYWSDIDMAARLGFLPYVHYVAAGLTSFALLLANVIGRRGD